MKALVGCAGFGGVDLALKSFGFKTLGIEIDPAIAEVNRCNGGPVITADILGLNPADFIGYLLIHFSPPCPSYSVARNSNAKQNIYARISDLAYYQTLVNGESEWDIRMARKICEFIRVCRPQYFTLENVWGYRKSLSWQLIKFTLLEAGYGVDWWHLNAANYGVAQTRKRMIAIARRDGRQPAKPWPTHAKVPDMFTAPWVGWYEAIEDLIPGLPETQFADWQQDKMPTEMSRAFILGQGNYSNPKEAVKPYDTVTGNTNQTSVKAFIINSQNTSRDLTVRAEAEPIFTVTANSMEKNSPPKAFIVDCQNNGNGKDRGLTIRTDSQPMFTVTASQNKRTIRACQGGIVVSMTTRALARFQDFPDSFRLPANRELACRGIGNAVPPALYKAVLRSLDL